MRSKVSLRVSPAALKAQGKRVLSEKIAVGELFRQAGAGGNARFRLLTKCGVQGDHPPAGVWGRAPKPYAAAFFVSVASVRRTQETRLFPKPWVFQRSEAGGNARFFIFV